MNASCSCETALDWWQRSSSAGNKRQRRLLRPATNPTMAATLFWQGTSGISYMDAAWQQQQARQVVILQGTTAKTWTLRSLAARFVVATRPSQFTTPITAHETSTTDEATPVPQVIMLDSSTQATHIPSLVHVVTTTLLRFTKTADDLQECLERIHCITVDNDHDDNWIATLRVLQQALLDNPTPILLLWDACPLLALKNNNHNLTLAWTRLVQTCCHDNVAMVLTTAPCSTKVTVLPAVTSCRSIQLDHRQGNGKDGVATLLSDEDDDNHHDTNHQTFPFSMSLGGILS